MSDTSRRYRAIKQALMQFYQPRPTGDQERHLNTLVALIRVNVPIFLRLPTMPPPTVLTKK